MILRWILICSNVESTATRKVGGGSAYAPAQGHYTHGAFRESKCAQGMCKPGISMRSPNFILRKQCLSRSEDLHHLRARFSLARLCPCR
jgi:hypothetical protein